MQDLFDVIEERVEGNNVVLYSIDTKEEEEDVSIDEYAKISRQIFSYPNKDDRNIVFTDNNFYLCENIDDENGTFDIVLQLQIDGNEDLIKKFYNGIYRTPEIDALLVRTGRNESGWNVRDFLGTERQRRGDRRYDRLYSSDKTNSTRNNRLFDKDSKSEKEELDNENNGVVDDWVDYSIATNPAAYDEEFANPTANMGNSVPKDMLELVNAKTENVKDYRKRIKEEKKKASSKLSYTDKTVEDFKDDTSTAKVRINNENRSIIYNNFCSNRDR